MLRGTGPPNWTGLEVVAPASQPLHSPHGKGLAGQATGLARHRQGCIWTGPPHWADMELASAPASQPLYPPHGQGLAGPAKCLARHWQGLASHDQGLVSPQGRCSAGAGKHLYRRCQSHSATLPTVVTVIEIVLFLKVISSCFNRNREDSARVELKFHPRSNASVT